MYKKLTDLTGPIFTCSNCVIELHSSLDEMTACIYFLRCADVCICVGHEHREDILSCVVDTGVVRM